MLNEAQIYSEASRIILIAMGSKKTSRGRGRRSTITWNADEDRLGHWSGVEAVVSLVERATTSKTTAQPKLESAQPAHRSPVPIARAYSEIKPDERQEQRS